MTEPNILDTVKNTDMSSENGERIYAPLYRFTHMNDVHNTQIFTFLLLPHLLCTTTPEVQSAPFPYANHLWILRFRKSQTHLGALLELKSPPLYHPPSCCDRQEEETGHSHRAQIPTTKNPVRTLSVDFQITLKSLDHFAKNEVYNRKTVTFSDVQPLHGRKRLIELSQLSSRHYLFDDGKCVIELELSNARVTLNLWGHPCADPLIDSIMDNTNRHAVKRCMTLTRLDGSIVNICAKSMHFESGLFQYADATWYLTFDLKSPELGSSEGQTMNLDYHEFNIQVEISLVRQVSRTRNRKSTTSRQMNTHRVRCAAILPGDCDTGMMEFFIGSQGWPLQAHQVNFHHLPPETDLRTSSRIGDNSGSARCLLLAAASETTLSCTMNILNLSSVTLIDVPLINVGQQGRVASPKPIRLIDPFQRVWQLQPRTGGRLLRLQLSPLQDCDSPARRRGVEVNHSNPQAPSCSTTAGLLGLDMQINALTPKLHKPVSRVSSMLTQLIRRNQPMITSVGQRTGILCDSGESDRNYQNGIGHQHHQIGDPNLDEKHERCDIVMDILVEEALDKNTGLINPLNGTISVEVNWVYHHSICLDRIHPVDALDQRHLVQMRNELNCLRKERDEFERRLMMTEMGLVQVDANSRGPMNLVPKESVSTIDNLRDSRDLCETYDNAELSYQSGSHLQLHDTRQSNRSINLQRDDHRATYGSRKSLASSHPQSCTNRSVRNSDRSYDRYYSPVRSEHRMSVERESPYRGMASEFSRTCDRSSVTSERDRTRIPERRKQFIRSKSTWQTCDSYHGSNGDPISLPNSATQPNTSWSTPSARYRNYDDSNNATAAALVSNSNFRNDEDETLFTEQRGVIRPERFVYPPYSYGTGYHNSGTHHRYNN